MMRFRYQLWKGALALLCAAGAAPAQTSEELQGRYGPPLKAEHARRPGLWVGYGSPLVETFVVRPDVSLTVTYTADGEACRAEINPYSSAPEQFPPPEVISAEEVTKIVGEVTSADVASSESKPAGRAFHGSCSAVFVERHEGFELSSAVRTEKCGGGVYSAVMDWRGAGRRCAARRPAASPRRTSRWPLAREGVARRWL